MIKLNFSIDRKLSIDQTKAQAVVLFIPDTVKSKAQSQSIPADILTYIKTVISEGDFKTTAGNCLLLRHLPILQSSRLILVGAGKGNIKDLKEATKALVAQLKASEIKDVALGLHMLKELTEQQVEIIVSTAMAATYQYTLTKDQKEEVKKSTDVYLTHHSTHAAILESGLKRGLGIAHGVAFMRELANRPANYATPTYLATTAQELAKEYPTIKSKIYDAKEVEKLGMGAFLSVAKGSAEPLKFIVMRYSGADKKQAPIALVGKGITFDSGGISLKPGAGMDEMKFDMSGAASVLGVFKALGELKPKLNVVGVIVSCENMPSGTATKPGDVVTSMAGKTIEVLNTDAEGRLVLCDALTYVQKYEPQAIIDIATLTGACVIALGGVNSGLFSNDKKLQDELYAAGQQADDRCWPMPMDAEYDEQLKSNFADIANIGGREAGSVTAAMFLQRFVTKYKWAHLDIAGTAYMSGDKKGSTGRPVPLLVNYLLNKVQ